MYTGYLLLANGKKFDFFLLKNLLAETFAWNTKFLFSRENEKETNFPLLNCNSWQRRHFQDPVHLECRKTKPHFFPLCKKRIRLLTSARCHYECLRVTGLCIFNMIFSLALYKINVFFNSSPIRILTQCIPLGLVCVHVCACSTNTSLRSFVCVPFILVFIVEIWKPSIKYDDLCPPASFITSILNKELMNF